jgi:hypothetical protein
MIMDAARNALATVVTVVLLLAPGPAGGAAHTGRSAEVSTAGTPRDTDNGLDAKRTRKKRRVYVTPGYTAKRKKVRVSPVDPPARQMIPLADAGLEPRILLDAAGTAHITWTEPAPGGNGQTEVYCRLPRGAKTCDTVKKWPEAYKPAVDPNFSAGNVDGMQPLALGDDLALISSRYPYQTIEIPGRPPLGTPDYQSAWATFLDLSVDGGSTFAPRTWIGDLPVRDAAVVGPAQSPSIVGITDSYPLGGTSVQTYVGGQQTVRAAELGAEFNDFVGGRVVDDTGRPLAVWRNLDGNGFLGRWTGSGDPNDAKTWDKAPIGPAYAAALASGPAGAFLLTQPGPYTTTPQLRRVSGLSLGPAVGTAPGEWATVQQDGAGRVYVGSLDPGTRSVFRVQIGDGTTFGPAIPVAKTTDGQPFSGARLGGASAPRFAVRPDGGGVAVLESENGSYSKIWAASFGTLAPTGQPGLGGLPGEGVIGPEAVVECGRIAFGAVEMRTEQGCFFTSTAPGASKKLRVSLGPVDLNGLWLRPGKGVQIQIDPAKKTIDTTGAVKVQLDAPGGPITLWNGEMHLKLPKATKGTLLASFDTSKFAAQLKGFPISGKIDVELTDKGVRIPVYLKLPKAFGGAKGEAVLSADLGSGLRLETLRIEIKEAYLAGPTLRKAVLEYTADKDEWRGEAELVMPPGYGSAAFAATVRFSGGAFKQGTVEVTLAYPGLPLFTGVYLAKVDGDFALDPTKITVGGTVGVLPSGGTFLVVNKADATITFGTPWQMQVVGDSKVLDLISVQQMKMLLRGDGFLSYEGKGTMGLTFIGFGMSLESDLSMAFDLQKELFSGKFSGGTAYLNFPAPAPDISVSASKAVISSRGVGLCSGGAGFRYTYASSDLALYPPSFWGGGSCNLGPIQVPLSGKQALALRRRATGGLRLSGGNLAYLHIDGDGGAPAVTLIDPKGTRIEPLLPATLDEAKAARAVALEAGTQTIIMLRNPGKGSWRVELAPGSAPITRIRLTETQPAPRLKARIVRTRGRSEVRYTLRGGTQLGAIISERTRSGATRVIGEIKQGKGILRIPTGGPKGRRVLRAELTRGGIPVTSVSIGRYSAPAPPKPGKAWGLRIKRTTKGVLVRWRSTPRADAQSLVVRSGDGMARRTTLGPKASKARITGIDRDDRVTAVLRGVSDDGVLGPAAQARLKPAKSRR